MSYGPSPILANNCTHNMFITSIEANISKNHITMASFLSILVTTSYVTYPKRGTDLQLINERNAQLENFLIIFTWHRSGPNTSDMT